MQPPDVPTTTVIKPAITAKVKSKTYNDILSIMPLNRNTQSLGRQSPSIAILACHTPTRFTARSTAGAGTTNANDTGTTINSAIVKKRVMLGFMTRK